MKALFLLLTLFPALSCLAQEWNLDKCLSYALENNKELLSSQYGVDIQRIERKTVQSNLFPEISVNAGLDYYWKVPVQTLPGELAGESPGTFITVPTTTTHAGNYSLDMWLNLFNVETWSRIKLEALKEQARKQEYISIEKLLSKNVSISFYLFQQHNNSLTAAKHRYDNQVQIHNLIEKLFGEGVTDQIALNQSLSLLKEQEEIYIRTAHVLENSLVDLKFWMGYPLDSLLTIEQGNDIPRPDNMGFEASRLPDYELQRLRVDIAEKQHKNSASAFYPKLEAVGSYGQFGFGETGRYIARSSAWHTSSFIGLRLSIPLFSLSNINSSRKGKIQVAQARQDFAYYEDSQCKAFLQQSNNLQCSWETLTILNEKLRLAEESERLCMQKIEKGIIDMLQLKQVQQDLIEEQEKYNQAKTNYLKHYVEIIYLQGR
ncbi:MAG: TolC family protein [Tannerellaceae bacterium]|jgi:outer membrane protein TolC|nr:TolC family protein [Tannerellaceae bacterium]